MNFIYSKSSYVNRSLFKLITITRLSRSSDCFSKKLSTAYSRCSTNQDSFLNYNLNNKNAISLINSRFNSTQTSDKGKFK